MSENQDIQNQNTENNSSVIEFKVSCPKCGVVFSLPVELGGEMAECSECEDVFQIPIYDEKENFEVTETGTIKAVEGMVEDENHRTVRLSRTNIGMKPTLKSNFEFGTKSLPTDNRIT